MSLTDLYRVPNRELFSEIIEHFFSDISIESMSVYAVDLKTAPFACPLFPIKPRGSKALRKIKRAAKTGIIFTALMKLILRCLHPDQA